MISRIQQGEKQLLEVLAQNYYQDVYRFCFFKTGNSEAAADCTQETFLNLIRFIDAYVDKRKFKSYLLTIARNVCNDYFRSHSIVTVPEDCLKEVGVAECQFTRVELEDTVQKILNQLPEPQKDVVILRFYYDLKIREIAKITGAGIPTVKSRLKQGMNRLKQLLGKEGIW